MKLSHFQFDLPEGLLAEYPSENRDESKLMVLNRKEQTIVIVSHNSFINRFMGRKIGLIENGDEELLHCHPYKYILK